MGIYLRRRRIKWTLYEIKSCAWKRLRWKLEMKEHELWKQQIIPDCMFRDKDMPCYRSCKPSVRFNVPTLKMKEDFDDYLTDNNCIDQTKFEGTMSVSREGKLPFGVTWAHWELQGLRLNPASMTRWIILLRCMEHIKRKNDTRVFHLVFSDCSLWTSFSRRTSKWFPISQMAESLVAWQYLDTALKLELPSFRWI